MINSADSRSTSIRDTTIFRPPSVLRKDFRQGPLPEFESGFGNQLSMQLAGPLADLQCLRFEQ